jgi:hypothetical protein
VGFNYFVLGTALLIGVAGGVAIVRALPRRTLLAALGVGALTGAALSAVALVVVAVFTGLDPFAVIHLGYLVVTVAIPLAALVALASVRTNPPAMRWLLVVLVLPAPLGLYATHIEPFWLRVDQVTVPLAAGDQFEVRIGVISDLQAEHVGDYERDVITTLLEQSPDIVFVAGDVWQMDPDLFPDRIGEFADLFREMCARVDHVFVVNGNTDRLPGLRKITAGTGAVVLDDEVVDVFIDGVPVRVLGVTYNGSKERFAAAKAAFFEPSAPDPIRVVLAHQPDEIYRFDAGDPVDLLVAGHTHGGQVSLPLLGPLMTFSSVPRSVAAGGLHRVDGHYLYVSTGVGRERGYSPQMRFGVRPSVGVLDLEST